MRRAMHGSVGYQIARAILIAIALVGGVVLAMLAFSR